MKYGLLTIVPILLNALVGKQSGAVILVSFIAVVGIIHAARLISGEGKIYEYHYVKYEGNIDQLLLELYSIGLELKKKNEQIYIIGSKNAILVHNKFILKDYVSYCSLLVSETVSRVLRQNIPLIKSDN
ncbi:MAG: hypothetical protein LN590_07615 [Rickettsia endosymbiont of Glossina mortisans submortisans]|nr:hypothetical protein [Rickettsia endosymbiont of Glossina mortisans submortisans]